MATESRLEQANAILRTYAPECRLEQSSGLYLAWTDFRGTKHRKKWTPQSRGSDFPSIYNRVPFGGTCCCATMELTRWVRDLPVRPLGMWKHFCSKTVGMQPDALKLAAEYGWPKQVPCVMCGRLLGDGVPYDHYDHDTLEHPGPGCWYTEGCQTRPEPTTPSPQEPVQ